MVLENNFNPITFPSPLYFLHSYIFYLCILGKLCILGMLSSFLFQTRIPQMDECFDGRKFSISLDLACFNALGITFIK